MGPRQEYRLGERIGILAGSALAPAMVGALRKYRPIHAEDVARAMIAISTDEREGRQVYEYDQIMRLRGNFRMRIRRGLKSSRNEKWGKA